MKLSLLIEKEILKYLANEINKYNKMIPYYEQDTQEKDIEISNLVQSISLTCWDWFKLLSNLINCSNNFYSTPIINKSKTFDLISNFNEGGDKDNNNNNNNKFKLIKNENINYLKLSFSDFNIEELENQKLKLINSINLNLLNNNFKNLEQLIISNGSLDDDIYLINKINFNNIKIGFFFLNTLNEIQEEYEIKTPLSENIKEIVDVEGTHLSSDRFISIFKNLKKVKNFVGDKFDIDFYKLLYQNLNGKSIEQIKEVDSLNELEEQSNIENCFSSIRSFTNSQVQTIESLYYLLLLSRSSTTTSSSKLSNLSIKICFDNLVYYLSGKKTKGCMCSQIHKCNENFIFYWNEISKMIENSNNLKMLDFSHHCYFPIAYAQEFSLPNDFVDIFTSMIINNKSIKIFKSNGLPPNSFNMFKKIIENNSTITRYQAYFVNMTVNMTTDQNKNYVDNFKNLLEQNKHVEIFFIDDSSLGDVLTYKNLPIKN